jgi:16S rRNA (cytosine967-C5)-methyltransferase
MAQLSARRVALTGLRAWRKEGRFADAIISKLLAETKLNTPDRAFALELFYGLLRNLTLLDFWIGCLRAASVNVGLRDVLRLGLYQLFLLETAEHAAVYETVELAPKRQRTVINGMLRAAIRQRSELLRRASAQPLFVRASHPQFLIVRWQKNFGGEATEALCTWNNEPPPVYGRINQLKIDPGKFLSLYPESQPLAHRADFVEFRSLPSRALALGHCYVQDPSTLIACQLLDPKPAEKILDACAAPGGKTAYIAQLMKNRGTIVACDRDPSRLQVLKDNMARLGVCIVQSFCHDWTRDHISKKIASVAPFDRILVDAPCTNTGVMRRRVDVRWRLRPEDLVRRPDQQFEITRAATSLLKPGGVLVYSTCSIEPEENRHLVERLLNHFLQMRLGEERSSLPLRDHFDGAFTAVLVNSA